MSQYIIRESVCYTQVTCQLQHSTIVSKVKCPRYRPGVAHRVGRGIALLFQDLSTRRR
jgi:hypothetical protein